MSYRILVINPGSTSTKTAVYEDDELIWESKISHNVDEIAPFPTVYSQKDFRMNLIISELEKAGIGLNSLDAITARGGMLKPLESGTYSVNREMVDYLKEAKRGEHASNLGAVIAFDLGNQLGIPSFIVDPVSVDEMEPIARISGMADIERTCIFHALNQKAIARQVAEEKNTEYEKLNLIVAHLGGGISVACHQKGRVIDVNNALDGEGPMSTERSGTVPLGPLYRMCFSGKYTLEEIKRKNYGQGGIVSYLGTNDAREIVKMIAQGDEYAKLIFDAMIYQIAKEIGACATVFKGKVDYIVLTGGLAYREYLVKELTERVQFLAPVLVYPGENEMLALVKGALRVLKGEESAKVFTTD
ncbi:MAG TPA: butyrate kinase [Bacilli bacterium]|jgi:butyrate kinase|nr:MAG: putative butyrate kinase 2 [Tenericutes bacterium ADurb.Bin140]HOE77713.1 butyrate kinase [Bacilli bacterium]HON64127.1 butyrate kinase [Bacilli bacterium]HOR95864.1 butyrate kinase [Bacilli bacterium]HPK58603.1 butyrate kinase [Bacilli bacterium]